MKHLKTMYTNMTRSAAYALVAITALTTLTGCPETQGTFTPPPALTFANVSSSAGTAAVGEVVDVNWAFNNEELLVAQRARLISLTFAGLSATDFVELPVTDRFLDFEYFGPRMVEIVADDADGVADTVTFEIRPDEQPFMRATVRNGVNGYPRLGATTTRSRTINFHQFFGAFDPKNNANGVLDDIVPFGLSTGVPFRGLSFSPNESVAFDLRQGSSYPLQSILDPTIGVANTVVYGGGFSYDGTVFNIKTADGNVEGRRGTTQFEAIYMTVVLQVFETINPVIVDVQLGNVAQGMVVSMNSYGMGGTGFGTAVLNPASDLLNNGTISGNIKGSTLGMPVTDINGNIFDAFVAVDTIEFNMPYLRDDDLQARLF